MYDFSGEWVYGIGMPAKSGVAGGIVAVLPGQLGIGVFSPPLDSRGNSARGVDVCRALSQELGLHFLQPPRPTVSTLRSNYTLSNKRSRRRRPRPEMQLLDEFGGRVAIHELQGDLRFSTVERIVREVVDRSKSLDYVILDFKRVLNIDAASVDALIELARCCTDGGLHLVFTRTRSDLLQQGYEAAQQKGSAISLRFESELDLAIEWCEQELLARYSSTIKNHAVDGTRNRIPLAEHQLCLGMSPQDLTILEQRVEQRSYAPGSLIFKRGEPADALFFLMKGDVSVVLDLPGGAVKRLATLCAGMGFGEASLITGGTRTADIRADNEVECLVLNATVFSSFEEKHPRLSIHLFRNLLRNSNEITSRLTAEVASLEA